MENNKQMSLGKCPACTSTNVDWDNWNDGDPSKNIPISQEGICCICGCKFKEYYTYMHTIIESKRE